MSAAREKHRAHRRKTLEAVKKNAGSVTLVQPISSPAKEKIKEKIKVSTKSRSSALIGGEGRSMTMDLD